MINSYKTLQEPHTNIDRNASLTIGQAAAIHDNCQNQKLHGRKSDKQADKKITTNTVMSLSASSNMGIEVEDLILLALFAGRSLSTKPSAHTTAAKT